MSAKMTVVKPIALDIRFGIGEADLDKPKVAEPRTKAADQN